MQLTRTEGGYHAELQLRPERGLLTLQAGAASNVDAPPLPMARRIALWRPLLDRLFREQQRRSSYLLAVGEYPELSERLARAAACSGEWDVGAGAPLTGSSDNAVKKLLADGRFYTELRELVNPFRYDVSVESVEAVVLCAWKTVPNAAVDCPRVVAADAQVPCGASLLFRVTAQS